MTSKEQRYNAVYGAYVAAQVQEYIREGNNGPDYETMRRFVEEAHSVAELSEEVQDFEPELEDDYDPKYDGYGVVDNDE